MWLRCFSLALLVSACDPGSSSPEVPPPDAVPDLAPPPSAQGCSNGWMCDGRCVDVSSDAQNCGECGHDCGALTGVDPAKVSCVQGSCAYAGACLHGRAHCTSAPDDGCETNLASNSDCGACGNACPGNQFCAATSAGGSTFMCQSGCPTFAPTNCNGTCVDTNSTAWACGGCGITCRAKNNSGAKCTNGVCGVDCSPSFPTECPNACVNTASDIMNCGACGMVCPALPGGGTPTCTMGKCDGTCPSTLNHCGGACVADSVDSCGPSCAKCVAPAHGTIYCDGGRHDCEAICDSGYIVCNINQCCALWNSENVDPLTGGASEAAIAVDGSGKPRLAYHNPTDNTLMYAAWSGTAWSIETVDTTAGAGTAPTLAVDGSGNPHIAYVIGTAGVHYAHKVGSAWTLQTVDDKAGGAAIALDGSGSPLVALRSTTAGVELAGTNGTTWSAQVIDGATWSGTGVALAVDSAGTKHVLYSAGNSVLYARSNGAGWSINTTFSSGTFINSIGLAVGADKTPHACFVTGSNVEYTHLGGASWDAPTFLGAAAAQPCSIALDGSGHPRVGYTGYNSNVGYVAFDGSNWNSSLPGVNGEGVRLASAGSVVHAAWIAVNYTLTHATFNGTWSSDIVDKKITASVPLAATDSAGHPNLLFTGTNGLTWARRTTSWTLVPVGMSVTPLDFALDAADRPAFVYNEVSGSNTRLRLAHYNGSTWDLSTVDAPAGVSVGSAASLIYDHAGNPQVAYVDDSNRDLKYAHWTGSAFAAETVDAPNDEGYTPSLAVDASNHARILYAGTRIRFASSNGSSWSFSDFGPSYTDWTSLGPGGTMGAYQAYPVPMVGAPPSFTAPSGLTNRYCSRAVFDAAGGAHIACSDLGYYVYYASLPVGGSAWTLETAASNRYVKYQQQVLRLDAAGKPWMAMLESRTGRIQYLSRP